MPEADPPPMTNQVEGGPPYKKNPSGMLLVPGAFYIDTFYLTTATSSVLRTNPVASSVPG